MATDYVTLRNENIFIATDQGLGYLYNQGTKHKFRYVDGKSCRKLFSLDDQ